MNGCLLERLVLISLNPVKALPHHVSPPFSGSSSATSTNLTFYQQHELFSIIHNEMLLCLSWPLDLVSHLDAARLREHFSNELLLIEVFLCWENHCFSDEGALVLFFFFSDGVNTFDLEPTNSAPTKTRLMLSPSFLAITDRSLIPSLSSNTSLLPSLQCSSYCTADSAVYFLFSCQWTSWEFPGWHEILMRCQTLLYVC